MRTVETTVYQFEELSDDAKERAREWYKGPGFCFAWLDESVESIEVFCERFGVRLRAYRCVPNELPFHITTDVDNACFRGLRLNQFNRDHMPTGYALDCALWQTFVDEWKPHRECKGSIHPRPRGRIRRVARRPRVSTYQRVCG